MYGLMRRSRRFLPFTLERKVQLMKINDIGRIGAINNYQRQVESHRQGGSQKSRRKDEVSFSAEAMELLKAQNNSDVANTQDSGRARYIENLKSQVSEGTYQVDAGKLAEKLAPYFKSPYSDQ